ncbi:PBP1A family penicillin-binding protein [uncultured Sphingomonas sp.]|uniref:transglycosylase domain-containing protein n=1 Tax=uncultured Sphingomonas sp. TaxID=158754 RepID=UPI0025882418|nr:PBP1A family penicillin-binding protein [uncultured Sphingomonas sp.]
MARTPKSPQQRPAAAPSRWWRILRWVLGIGVGLALFGAIALVVAVYNAKANLPSFNQLKSSPNGQMIRVRAADGSILVSLGPSYGEWIPYAQIPAAMREAMVSVEDRRFRSHWGVDPVALARITKFAIDNRGTGRRLQGASTITQQVARTIFLSNSYTVGRKFREIILALALERKFTKNQILELYLNKVYFGGGAYGIDAASRRFFNHPATTLSLSEAAVVAGLVKAPSRYSPTADAEAAVGRAGVVLKLMQETGAITASEAMDADPKAIRLAPEPQQNSVRYFTDWALPQLETLIDETEAPLDVWTTLDPSMQKSADTAIRANAPAGVQGALVALDRDGAVRAMVGGKDYVSSIYNRATQATRQPGSAWKLFVYLAALEAGMNPDSQVNDAPVTIDGWTPRNASRRYSGQVSLRTAFAYSLNTVSARLGQEVGFATVADMARRFGITTPVNTRPAMVLGTSDVRLIDLTRAYASVASGGTAVVPYGITRVTANGSVIYQHQVDSSRVLVAPYVAQQMTDLLQTAVNTGTGRAAQIGRPVAGKTGTTTSYKDGWFMGFSSGITTGVWMGRDDAKAVAGLQGGTAPARAFAAFMRQAVANRPVEEFNTKVTLPEWQEEPDAESYYGAPDDRVYVDPDGNPVEQPRATQPDATVDDGDEPLPPQQRVPDEQLDQDWIDRALGRNPRGEQGAPPPRRPAPDRRQPPPADRYPDEDARPYQ